MTSEPIPVSFSRLGAEILRLVNGETKTAPDIAKGDVIRLDSLTVQITKTSNNVVRGSFITYYFSGLATKEDRP